ncbi:hypothetical protein AVEN_132865-1 [Araneus ventricosus]|uniref:Uncharacterized protein n=1 Tax=Araneus ventricosus TaxID=182803 RepID=A0A4Y2GS83_ARAVE|nr:hypothetical protein AVEN_132865-1 [Araneus ventricosus]
MPLMTKKIIDAAISILFFLQRDLSQHSNCGWTWNFSCDGRSAVYLFQLFGHVLVFHRGLALDFARRGARPAVRGDECNEIGLKLSLDYYLSTTVEYPVQKFSPTWGAGPPFSTLTPPLIPRQNIILTANIVGKFGFIPIVTHDWLKNHGLNRLIMESVLSLKFRPMGIKIGTIYHWILTAGPKSAEEPHTGWSGFMKNVAGKRLYEKSIQSSDTLALRQSSAF